MRSQSLISWKRAGRPISLADWRDRADGERALVMWCLIGYRFLIFQFLVALVIGLTACVSRLAQAETIGIGLIIDQSLAEGSGKRQSLIDRYRRQVAELNDIYRNSEVSLRAEIVLLDFTPMRSHDASDLFEDMSHERNGFADLFAKADEYGADYIITITGKLVALGRPVCGKAIAVNKTIDEIANTKRALAVLDVACRTQTLAHELGHLMGLNHGDKVHECEPGKGHNSALTRYALGYAEGACDGRAGAGKYGTVMVGGWMKSIGGRGHLNLPIFSNPLIRDVRCGARGICGDPGTGDAARALNEHAGYYAAHESPDVHVLGYRDQRLQECIAIRYRGFEIEELTELTCPRVGIENLTGIEKLAHLRRIDLRGNALVDVTALEHLPQDRVEWIDLSENENISCIAISKLNERFLGKVRSPTHCRIESFMR